MRNYHHQPKENDIRSQHESIRKEEEYGSGSKEGKEPLPNCTHSPPDTIKKKKKKREKEIQKRDGKVMEEEEVSRKTFSVPRKSMCSRKCARPGSPSGSALKPIGGTSTSVPVHDPPRRKRRTGGSHTDIDAEGGTALVSSRIRDEQHLVEVGEGRQGMIRRCLLLGSWPLGSWALRLTLRWLPSTTRR